MQKLTENIRVGILLSALFCVFLGFGEIFAAPGDLDFSFGTQGRQVIYFYGQNPSSPSFEIPRQMAVQPDGKILVVGYASGQTFDLVVARLNPDSSLDLDFGVNGKVFLSFETDYDWGQAIALQPDGKILVGGETRFHEIPATRNTQYGLARLNADGTLDENFGEGGKIIVDFFQLLDSVTNITPLPNGKIVASGYVTNGADNTSAFDFGLVGLNPDGSLDKSFGTNGKVVTDFAGDKDAPARSFAMPDGKIIVAGSASQATLNNANFALARYNPNGSLDTSFDGDGKLMTDFSNGSTDTMTSAALTPDGKIVAVGWTTFATVGTYDYAVVRYNPDGSLDAGFDGDGIKTIDVGGNTNDSDWAAAVAVQQNGKIVVTGNSPLFPRTGGSDRDHTVLRLNQNGSIDTTFGNNGRVFVDFGVLQTSPPPATGFVGESGNGDVAIQPDGKIVFTGNYIYVGRYNVAVARLLGDPVSLKRPKFDFDGDKKADVSVYRDGIWHLLRSRDGYMAQQFGLSADKIVPADYDGDGRSDVAVYRDGIWYIYRSSDAAVSIFRFGLAGDFPQAGDYDGDGKADAAVFRPSDRTWYLLQSQNGFFATQFGLSEDKPVAEDYDGDGKMDIAVYRPSDGVWYLLGSRDGFSAQRFGISTDKPVPADYDGDGRTDIAVYRDGVWYISRSRDGILIYNFGLSQDKPTAADYDADGKADLSVYREGVWHLQQSASGYTSLQFGLTNDVPVPTAFLR
jgi:uncharacterized delta-60 repeat protein